MRAPWLVPAKPVVDAPPAPGPTAPDPGLVAILTAIEGVRTAVCRDLQEIANYLAPFRVAGVRGGTTTTAAYPAAHPDDGFAEADTIVVPSLTRRIDLVVSGATAAVVQWSPTGEHYEGGATYPAGFYPLPVSVRRLRVKTADATAAAQSTYSLTFWS